MFGSLKRRLFGIDGNFGKSNMRAKSRLQFVLVQDRAGLSGEEMAAFKEELVGVIEKYFVIDKKGFDVAYERSKEATTLLINSPILIKRQESCGKGVGARRGKKNQRAESNEAEAEVPAAGEKSPEAANAE